MYYGDRDKDNTLGDRHNIVLNVPAWWDLGEGRSVEINRPAQTFNRPSQEREGGRRASMEKL